MLRCGWLGRKKPGDGLKLFAVVEGKAVSMDVGEEGLLELRELCPIDIKQNSVFFRSGLFDCPAV